MRRVLRLAVSVLSVVVLIVPARADATGGEGETWPTFTESSSCGAQRVPTAHAPSSGGFGRDFILRGEFGAYFGRTVDDVFDAMVRWDVPGSSERLAVHPSVLPALETASADIEAAISEGSTYRIDPATTYSASARTIAGQIRISRHTYGTAFDVNASANPYRGDNTLVTDLPDWWVSSMLDAGFCWGGLWIGSKDAMHFAWQGPAFSGYTSLPDPLPPITDARPFAGAPDVVLRVDPRPIGSVAATVLADVDGNGAADVVRVTVDRNDVIVDASVAAQRHNACSVRRSILHDLTPRVTAAHTIGFGDWDGRGGNDLWIVQDEGGTLRLTVRWAFGGYSAETTVRTAVPTPGEDAWISTADVDVDGDVDLIVVDGGALTVWDVDPGTGATARQLRVPDPYPHATQRFLGDTDLDNRPDLMAIVDGAVAVAEADTGYASSAVRQRPSGMSPNLVDVVGSDYDGDGRVDLVAFDGRTKRVWLGNTPLPDDQTLETWFEAEDLECGDAPPSWPRSELRFSTSRWVAEGSHDWREAHGFATGCDPEDDACEPDPVTRRSFAEFVAWIDGLPAASTVSGRAAARAVERAGYQMPCASTDDGCLAAPMLRTELSPFFGMFLAKRRGDVPAPHRWVLPVPVAAPATPVPQ